MTGSSPALSSMDRPRTTPARSSRALQLSAIVATVAAVLLFGLTRPDEPVVERANVVIDTVQRGPFTHEVAAAGSLVAEQPRLIAAPVAGRVESIHVEPGERLRAGEVMLELSNRDARRELLEVEQQLSEAEADLADLAAALQAQSLESEKSVRRTEFEKLDAQRQAQAASELASQGLMPNLEALRLRENAEEVAARAVTESRRHAALARSADAQLAAQRNRLERLRALRAFHFADVESLIVRAPADTTARDIAVQQGEWVTEGQRLVRLVEPGRLKAVLLVPEAVAHEIRSGQPVTMNARGVTLRGEITRVGAAVDQGTLSADVKLDGALPAAARPDLSVEGRIVIARHDDVLSIARATQALPNSNAVLYKLDRSGQTARRTNIRFGPASVDRIVVSGGAAAGDRFIVAGLEEQTEAVIRVR